MQFVTEMLWTVAALSTLGGMCIGTGQIIRSGFLFLTARGNSEQVSKAKDILWRSVMGMAIVASAWVIIPR